MYLEDRRARAEGRAVREPQASVHGRAALRGSDRGSRAGTRAGAAGPRGRRPEPAEPAERVPVPSAARASRRATATIEEPPLYPFGADHVAACHYPLESWPLDAEEFKPGRAIEEPQEPGLVS